MVKKQEGAPEKLTQKKSHPAEKSRLHPRNRHRARYDLNALIEVHPDLKPFVRKNEYDDDSINFFDPAAVKALNLALLKKFYDITYWDVPADYLTPPVPGRADHIHYLADLLGASNGDAKKPNIPKGKNIKVLDLGVGSNCIYPIIGVKEYGWSFSGTEIDMTAMESAQKIVDANPSLKDRVDIRKQYVPTSMFHGIFRHEERFDLTICNPPFHASEEEAIKAASRKLSNLKQKKITVPVLNFGGKSKELWCEGGEEKFVKDMIRESAKHATACFWYSALIAHKSHLTNIYKTLKNAGVTDFKTIETGQGNKTSRIVAWTFLTPKQQMAWKKSRWAK